MKIEQKRFLCGRQSIDLVDDEKLRFTERRINRQLTFEIELIDLDPKMIYLNESSPGKLGTAIVTVGVGVWISTASIDPSTFDWIIGGFLLFVLAVFLGIGGWLVWTFQNGKAHGRFVYYRGGAFAFTLWHNQPNQAVYDLFVKELQVAIEAAEKKAMAKAGINNESMAQEVRELAKLREEGIISEEEYTAGKRRILGMDDPDRKIGFQ